jgi:hypothetical protein
MLYDRDPRLTLISDKLKVRGYVAERIGDQYLIPLLWKGGSPEDIPFGDLPDRYVIKTNHGCGYVIVVDDKVRVDKKETRRLLNKWLNENFGADRFLGIAWGYKNIKPMVMIEAFIGKHSMPPDDYKFWCFGGRVEVVSIHQDRFGDYKIGCFDRDFQTHELNFGSHQGVGIFLRPQNFEKMVHLAEELSKEYDFMRVDLYNNKDATYFGELTPYPGGVSARILPVSQDQLLGEKWP